MPLMGSDPRPLARVRKLERGFAAVGSGGRSAADEGESGEGGRQQGQGRGQRDLGADRGVDLEGRAVAGLPLGLVAVLSADNDDQVPSGEADIGSIGRRQSAGRVRVPPVLSVWIQFDRFGGAQVLASGYHGLCTKARSPPPSPSSSSWAPI